FPAKTGLVRMAVVQLADVESPTAIIPAASERQAMDWSLVLVSQGIESMVERDAESGRWQIVVSRPDVSRAVNAIRLYTLENRARRWQLAVPGTGLLFDWRCLACLLFFVVVFAFEATGRGNLRAAGVLDPGLVRAGQWWRVFTAVTLHADESHLAANVTTGVLMLGLAFGAYGPGLGMLGSYLAGVLAFVAEVFFVPRYSLGASGMVLGALGLLTAQWIALVRHGLTPGQFAVRGVVSGCLLLVLLGLSPEERVDVFAHIAGFCAGLVLGAVLAWLPPAVVRSAWMDRVALAATALLVFGPWWMALAARG
ncbi:MAG TPA: rhomboid family intramembrane serine protease, partial [Verrucomicrobiae bacterium]|nr:rhomboid family intramembrane serine protease [Verrucomicrobiae bacterium]